MPRTDFVSIYKAVKPTMNGRLYDLSQGTCLLRQHRLLSAAVASWQQAVSKSCANVTYKEDADPTVSGCGNGPLSLPPRGLEKRTPLCDNCNAPVETCTYTATICAGTDHISE